MRLRALAGIAGNACDVNPDVLYCSNRENLDGRCEMRTLYGPIDSWRFGRSLGVDPLAGKEKRCPFSCTYCQYGETLHPTWRRQPFVSVNRLEADLDLLGAVAADCVTFAGLGEPTLATNLPDLVAAVRRRFQRPVIVLTNSALIPDGNVRRDLLCFDAVVAKLDAPDAALFQQTNRPGSGFPYSLGAIVEGIRRFRRMYGGRLILQIMFVQASMHAVPRMARLARSLQPDEVQLDTPLQPALGGPLSRTEMQAVEVAFAGLPVRSVYAGDGVQVKPRFM